MVILNSPFLEIGSSIEFLRSFIDSTATLGIGSSIEVLGIGSGGGACEAQPHGSVVCTSRRVVEPVEPTS